MRPPLEVRTSPEFWKRVTLLYALLVPFAALGLVQAIANLDRGGQSAETAYMILPIVLFMLLAPLGLLVGRRSWVMRFDERGVTLRNGRVFLWTDFVRAEPRKRGRHFINNYDLVFRTGTASVYHLMAANHAEVMEVVNGLLRGQNPFLAR